MRIHGGDSGRDKKKKKNDSCVNQNSASVFQRARALSFSQVE